MFETDEGTWIGHAVQGFLFTLALGFFDIRFAVGFVFGAFLHREVSDFLKHLADKDPDKKGYREDGWMDFITPIIAIAPALFLLSIFGVVS
jgi:hypothetical protein